MFREWRGDKLHLGCGNNRMPGWLNVGIPGDIRRDLRKPFRVRDGGARFIYSEHVIEHLTRDEGAALFRECRRVLGSGGVMRISTPDLESLARHYLEGRPWSDAYWQPQTPARFLNEALRLWGHEFVYDFDELAAALRLAGFATVERRAWRESPHPELRGLETRDWHGELIVEAQ